MNTINKGCEASQKIVLGACYTHFKGNVYRVLELVNLALPDSKELVQAVLYTNGSDYYVRTAEDFLYDGKLSDGSTGKRFSLVP